MPTCRVPRRVLRTTVGTNRRITGWFDLLALRGVHSGLHTRRSGNKAADRCKLQASLATMWLIEAGAQELRRDIAGVKRHAGRRRISPGPVLPQLANEVWHPGRRALLRSAAASIDAREHVFVDVGRIALKRAGAWDDAAKCAELGMEPATAARRIVKRPCWYSHGSAAS
jgi:hypothetical protein